MFIESFLQYMRYERGFSSHTITAYENDLRQFEEFLQNRSSGCDPIRADQQAVRSWIVLLMSDGMSERTVRRKISALRTYYHYCLRQEIIEQDPTRGVPLPRVRKKLPRYVREPEMENLLSEHAFSRDFIGIRNRLILQLFYETGIRSAELVGLFDRDVLLEERRIKVLGKRNRERIVPFGESLFESICAYRELRDKVVAPASDYFFVCENGAPIYAKLVYRVVRANLGRVSTLEKRSPHVLRHTFATSMLNGGASLNGVKELLGHRSLVSTQVYTHVSLEELKSNYKQAHPRADIQ